jgi:hypothetical protein
VMTKKGVGPGEGDSTDDACETEIPCVGINPQETETAGMFVFLVWTAIMSAVFLASIALTRCRRG